MILKNIGEDLTHSVISVNNGNNIDLYKMLFRERDYFEKEILAKFITDLVFSSNKDINITREKYFETVMKSILCNFDVSNISLFTKIYLN